MDEDAAIPHSSAGDVFALLRAGVPLSLIFDLAAPVRSADLLREEWADTSWVPSLTA